MQPLLPKLEGLRIVTHKGRLDTKAIAQVDQLILVLPERPGEALFRRIPGGTIRGRRW